MSTDLASVLRLEDERATDATVAGGKAAALARLRGLGLPVAPGVVVPARCARPALQLGARALAEGGSGKARLAVMQASLDGRLLDDLVEAVRPLGSSLVVRSSSALEGGTAWAGAFSTFQDVAPGELGVALRGVWASAFTVDALRRCELEGVDPGGLTLAVLVQPQLRPDVGGTARVLDAGSVRVTGTDGPLAELVTGWEAGATATVTAGGEIAGDEARERIGRDVLLEVAGFALRCREELGHDVVEWAHCQGSTVLLQSTASGAADRPGAPAPADPPEAMSSGPGQERCLALALAAARYSGPLGEALVMPWAAALDALPALGPARPSRAPRDDLQRAVELAGALTREVWQLRGGTAATEVDRVLRDLLGAGLGAVRQRLAALRPVPGARAREVLELLDGVAAAAVEAGLLGARRELWRYPVADAMRLLSGSATPRTAAGPGRWEPFVFAAVRAYGEHIAGGVPAVPGVAAGPLVVASDPHDPPRLTGREVVAVERPLPGFAPLLWRASALVTTGGSPGAHLLEVAHSLGVPAVVGAPLAAAGHTLDALRSGPARVMAVHGGEGSVTVA